MGVFGPKLTAEYKFWLISFEGASLKTVVESFQPYRANMDPASRSDRRDRSGWAGEEDAYSGESDFTQQPEQHTRGQSAPWQAGNGYHVHAPNTNKHQYVRPTVWHVKFNPNKHHCICSAVFCWR